jgi:glycosyltransferase involved in cell wall biosynthesis
MAAESPSRPLAHTARVSPADTAGSFFVLSTAVSFVPDHVRGHPPVNPERLRQFRFLTTGIGFDIIDEGPLSAAIGDMPITVLRWLDKRNSSVRVGRANRVSHHALLPILVNTARSIMSQLLVICHEVGISGGFLRFERIGRAVRAKGHDLAFVAFAREPERLRKCDFPVLTVDEAARREWHAVMLPGAGFPAKVLDDLGVFKARNFGRRVQHILNDQTRADLFMRACWSFEPHVLISNNRHWSKEELARFSAERIYFLEGAVDLESFAMCPRRAFPKDGPLTIGGLANKNPLPLLHAIRELRSVKLKLFGPPGALASLGRGLIEQGRLELVGVLDEQGLTSFYAGVDLIVHTESFAGWANLAAEAMAAGVPLICTPHGTLAFAENDKTAIVIPDATPASLIAAINKLRSTPELANILALAGRTRIQPFSWTTYADQLLTLIGASKA